VEVSSSPVTAPTFKPTILGFDAATGTSRTLAIDQRLLGAAHGGVFTFEARDQRSVALHQLDPAGNVVWSHTLASTIDSHELVASDQWPLIERFRARRRRGDPDGGVIVFGATPGLDLGDRTLAVTRPSSFSPGSTRPGARGGCRGRYDVR